MAEQTFLKLPDVFNRELKNDCFFQWSCILNHILIFLVIHSLTELYPSVFSVYSIACPLLKSLPLSNKNREVHRRS